MPDILKYYICMVEEINIKFKHWMAKGREMTKIVTDQIGRNKCNGESEYECRRIQMTYKWRNGAKKEEKW